MSYFNTRRTGDIQRRLAGIWQVREFIVEHAWPPTAVAAAASIALMAVYGPVLTLVFLDSSAVRYPDAVRGRSCSRLRRARGVARATSRSDRLAYQMVKRGADTTSASHAAQPSASSASASRPTSPMSYTGMIHSDAAERAVLMVGATIMKARCPSARWWPSTPSWRSPTSPSYPAQPLGRGTPRSCRNRPTTSSSRSPSRGATARPPRCARWRDQPPRIGFRRRAGIPSILDDHPGVPPHMVAIRAERLRQDDPRQVPGGPWSRPARSSRRRRSGR
jgi:hypothetical protein